MAASMSVVVSAFEPKAVLFIFHDIIIIVLPCSYWRVDQWSADLDYSGHTRLSQTEWKSPSPTFWAFTELGLVGQSISKMQQEIQIQNTKP